MVENIGDRKRRTARRSSESCFYHPLTYAESNDAKEQYYFAAQINHRTFEKAGINYPFQVGDNETYLGYHNAPLVPGKKIKVRFFG